jgi:hypothetical protein
MPNIQVVGGDGSGGHDGNSLFRESFAGGFSQPPVAASKKNKQYEG